MADSREVIQEEARRLNNKWWAQQQGKSVDEIVKLLSQPGGERPNPTLTYQASHFPALEQLQNEIGGLSGRATQNQALVGSQFSSLYPNGMRVVPDIHYGLPSSVGGNEVAALMNPNRSAALAEQMARLEEVYPGIARRMVTLGVGKTNAEGWNILAHRMMNADTPHGAVPYHMGLPAETRLLRDPTAAYRSSPALAAEPGWLAATDPLYAGQFESVAAHEFGHAVHGSMQDFVKGLPLDSEARMRFNALNLRLAENPASHLSRYAESGRVGEGMMSGTGMMRPGAANEPFAEMFSLARSPQGVDYLRTGSKNALRDLVAGREPSAAMKVADNVGHFNTVEKSLRNEGFSEIGAAAPDLVMQMGLPALAGLLATKTHGNAKAALSGAALGGGLGSLAGPEGTLIGGALGAGAGLARQLL